jgi:peptidoglycan/xylan/chitin deacetylase (PgdA/CDA1 family)
MACTLGFSVWQIRPALALFLALALWIVPASGGVTLANAAGANCPGNPDALGTSRVLSVDMSTPRVGRKHFPATLPLADKEVVLTFDDGPLPGPTNRVLDTLKSECVRATFFLLGRMTEKAPQLARRELAEGHTVAHHSYNHPWLAHLPLEKAMADIDRGIAADDTAVYGKAGTAPRVPFFRFPGFVASPPLLDRMAARGIVVFGADVWASDWNAMTPETELALTLSRLRQSHGGILLLHDTKRQTAAMLPGLLGALKAEGFRVVHIVPR